MVLGRLDTPSSSQVVLVAPLCALVIALVIGGVLTLFGRLGRLAFLLLDVDEQLSHVLDDRRRRLR